MPTDTVEDRYNCNEYNTILLQILGMKEGLALVHVIIGGDFNTDLSTTKSLLPQQMLCDNDFKSWCASEFSTADFSYESKINRARSLIDHFVLSEVSLMKYLELK